MYIFQLLIIYFNIYATTLTDIGAVYKHGILLFKNANQISYKLPQEAEEFSVDLPYSLEYPIALAHDPINKEIFIADANNKETEIFSLVISNHSSAINSLVPKLKRSTIDAITYDPISNQLFWTDSIKHGIYFSNITSLNSSSSPNLIANNQVYQPRGIAADYCNRHIYWTERDSKVPSIKKYNMIENTVEVFKLAGNNSFFQGIDYNSFMNELVWAETSGDDERNSTCKIIAKSLETGEEHHLGTFESCYPFALTSDLHYIYWTDWSRHGIMRLSRTNTKDLVKLVNTPPVKTEEGHHNGAFGIVNLREFFIKSNACDFGLGEEKSNLLNFNTTLETHQTIPHLTLPSVLSSSAKTDSLPEAFPFRNIRLTIIVLAFGLIFFFSTTLLLLCRIMSFHGGFFKIIKRFCMGAPKPSISKTPKKHKVHRRFGSKLKSVDKQLCSKGHDGIKIDIEDCCQMTLCDTPCYSSMKKEGKGYKQKSKSTDVEDKEELLQSIEIF